jgi:clan AA aspartic protease
MRVPRRNVMGLVHASVIVRPLVSKAGKKFEGVFLVDTGATDTMVPASKLRKIGIKPVGKKVYELADGRRLELSYGNAVLEFLGEITATRVIFGPENTEPLLGVTILESCGIVVSPKDQKLKRLPAVSLKRALVAA